jgi:hypothetical protein
MIESEKQQIVKETLGSETYLKNAEILKEVLDVRGIAWGAVCDAEAFMELSLKELDLKSIQSVTFVPECYSSLIVTLFHDKNNRVKLKIVPNKSQMAPHVISVELATNSVRKGLGQLFFSFIRKFSMPGYN